MSVNTYSGSIGPYAAAGYVAGKLLKRLLPLLTFEPFMSSEVLPTNNTKTMQWRRFLSLPPAMKPLTEGVTPGSLKLSAQEYTAVLDQYGSVVEVSDVTIQTSQDKIIQDLAQNMAEQAAQTIERVRYNVLKACVNKFYPGGATLRSQVNSPLNSIARFDCVRYKKRKGRLRPPSEPPARGPVPLTP
ncbi:N4-gp56 family major capsid protein [Candidatus Magnetobacterium casense]|uniref:N4-gp56 family major capsid protein n=1 Tax=Candidatus Magnetobacterium casense TaxID=1455061 RepID=A0ABS6RZF2_9BACT|nr:N4-gp56 family major capsid protein [Candidatus Magnetobacterium casensis]MBV6342030.1 N4-gp56 family major capsid protein [Candidatus Magnetobacterium casensis]